MLNNYKKSWIKRREKYGPAGRGKDGWDKKVERYGPTGRTFTMHIKGVGCHCPECGFTRLISCIRYDLTRLYYHCSKCGHNVRDRQEVTKILKRYGM